LPQWQDRIRAPDGVEPEAELIDVVEVVPVERRAHVAVRVHQESAGAHLRDVDSVGALGSCGGGDRERENGQEASHHS